MTNAKNINDYIENSKIRGKFARWKKSQVFVYITPVTNQNADKTFLYSEIKRAMTVWNESLKKLNTGICFYTTENCTNSDIIIHWTKVGRVFEGMCKYLSVIGDELKKVSIEVGLENEYSGKNTSNESIFFVMMHEFGHSLGLGHGIDVNDVMYVPHQKNVDTPSENDLFVLKTIYSNVNIS